MALRLTMAFSDNPRVQPLKDGAVKPQGIDLNCVTIEPGTLFFRNLMYDEFDVFEMSISETLLAIERRDVGRWDWSALPVFLSRGHHWPNFWVNTASSISGLADIRGKRIGVPDYDMTAALWFRITLKDLPDYALSSAIKVWYKTGTYGCFCGFERWRATRCNFKRGSARPSLLFFTEQRISAGRR